MGSRLQKMAWAKVVLVSVLGLAASATRAEPPCCPPQPVSPRCPSTTIAPFPTAPGIGQPVSPDQSGAGGQLDLGNGAASTDLAALPERGGGAGIGSSAELDPGYIDGAAPRTQVRIRFDAMYDNNRPDRADFFYPKCGCFGTPDAKGPPLPEKRVDSQELRFYAEYAATQRLSGFAELPLRYINPEINANASGIGDVNFGFKYAVIYSPEQIVSFQLRTSAPSGDPFKGLGTNNWTVEPAVLYERQLSNRVALLGEFRDNIPVAPLDDFAGQVLRYGAGVSYQAYRGERVRATLIEEVVGWTVLDGKEFSLDIPNGGTKNAAGDTIVNAKFGVRFNFGDTCDGGGFLSHSDLYVGYGRALTGAVWYKDVVRVEYRLRF